MARTNHTQRLAQTEEALTVLFCLVDDAYTLLNPDGRRRYERLKRLSDSEVIALVLFLAAAAGRGVRALLFARHPEVFLSPVPRGRRAPPFLVPSQGTQAPALPGAPATASRLRVGGRSRNPSDRFHPACRAAPQVGRSLRRFSGGGMGVRWGSFSIYGVKLHLLCATNGGCPSPTR